MTAARRLGFTLMEVNLAIFIMATGVLAMVSLYPLGYRENEQSKDDVKSAANADAVLNQLTAALSSRDITWQQWVNAVKSAQGQTPDGWMSYCQKKGSAYVPRKKGELTTKARAVFSALANVYSGPGGKPQWTPDNDLACALVAQWGRRPVAESEGVCRQPEDYSRVALSFRCTRQAGALFAAPIYYTEVHFQGDQKELK